VKSKPFEKLAFGMLHHYYFIAAKNHAELLEVYSKTTSVWFADDCSDKCGLVLLHQVMGSDHIQEKTELLYALINGRQLCTLPKLTQVHKS